MVTAVPGRSLRSLSRSLRSLSLSKGLGQRRELLAHALDIAGEDRAGFAGEVLVRPAALVVLRDDRLRVRPHLQAVTADADGLAGDAGSGVRGEIGDEPGDVVGGAEAEVVTEERGHGLALRVGLDG